MVPNSLQLLKLILEEWKQGHTIVGTPAKNLHLGLLFMKYKHLSGFSPGHGRLKFGS